MQNTRAPLHDMAPARWLIPAAPAGAVPQDVARIAPGMVHGRDERCPCVSDEHQDEALAGTCCAVEAGVFARSLSQSGEAALAARLMEPMDGEQALALADDLDRAAHDIYWFGDTEEDRDEERRADDVSVAAWWLRVVAERGFGVQVGTGRSASEAISSIADAAFSDPEPADAREPADADNAGSPHGSLLAPTASDEQVFWDAIEAAWSSAGPTAADIRQNILRGASAEELAVGRALRRFVRALRSHLLTLDMDALRAFDRVLERQLFELDRRDVHDLLDGSDDAFLYARCFVVAMGRSYTDAVRAGAAVVPQRADCEALCYLPSRVYAERFGVALDTGSGISRETGANREGWRSA